MAIPQPGEVRAREVLSPSRGKPLRLLVLSSTWPSRPDSGEPTFVETLTRSLSRDFQTRAVVPAHKTSFSPDGGHPLNKPEPDNANPAGVSDTLQVIHFRYAPRRMQVFGQGGIVPNLRHRPWTFLLLPGFLLAETWAIWQQMRRFHPDVIHAHWTIPQGVLAVLIRLLQRRAVPILVTSHGSDLLGFKGAWMRVLNRWVLSRINLLAVVGPPMRDLALNRYALSAERVKVLPMGVDLQHTFVPPASGQDRDGVIFVGRLVELKGVLVLIDALAEIARRGTGCRATLVGSGPLEGLVRERIRSSGLEGTIQMVGQVSHAQLAVLLRSHRIFVFPSLSTGPAGREGLGLTCIEAMGCACATVVSDTPSLRHVVENGVNGLVVPAGNAVALAAALQRLSDHPELAERLGQAARVAVVEDFDWPVAADRYRRVLKALASGGGASNGEA